MTLGNPRRRRKTNPCEAVHLMFPKEPGNRGSQRALLLEKTRRFDLKTPPVKNCLSTQEWIFGFLPINLSADERNLNLLKSFCPFCQESPEKLDRGRVKQAMKSQREYTLDRLAGEDDNDLLHGRFARKQQRAGATSAAPMSAMTRLNHSDSGKIKSEEELGKFLKPELQTYFASVQDASLFVKVLVCDGIVPKLVQGIFRLVK